MLNLPELPRHPGDGYDVEPDLPFVPDLTHIGGGRLIKHQFLLITDHLLRTAEIVVSPRLDFHKNKDAQVTSHKVDFRPPEPPITFEYGKALIPQKIRSQGFTPRTRYQVLVHAFNWMVK